MPDGGTSLGVCEPKRDVFLDVLDKMVSILAILLLKRVFCRRIYSFSSESIRPSTNAFHDVLSIGLN